MTLEWLLIVAAVAGLAAGTVLAVQSVLDETIDEPVRPEVQLIDADVAAAFLATEAQEAAAAAQATGGTYDDTVFRDRCEIDLPQRFADVVAGADWDPDPDWDPAGSELPQCTVTTVPPP